MPEFNGKVRLRLSIGVSLRSELDRERTRLCRKCVSHEAISVDELCY